MQLEQKSELHSLHYLGSKTIKKQNLQENISSLSRSPTRLAESNYFYIWYYFWISLTKIGGYLL